MLGIPLEGINQLLLADGTPASVSPTTRCSRSPQGDGAPTRRSGRGHGGKHHHCSHPSLVFRTCAFYAQRETQRRPAVRNTSLASGILVGDGYRQSFGSVELHGLSPRGTLPQAKQ